MVCAAVLRRKEFELGDPSQHCPNIWVPASPSRTKSLRVSQSRFGCLVNRRSGIDRDSEGGEILTMSPTRGNRTSIPDFDTASALSRNSRQALVWVPSPTDMPSSGPPVQPAVDPGNCLEQTLWHVHFPHLPRSRRRAAPDDGAVER